MRAFAALAAAGLGLAWATPAVAAGPNWQPLAQVKGVMDVGGPRADGKLVVAGSARLWLMDGTGALAPFAQGAGGYADDPGAEAYIAVSPGSSGSGCSFFSDDVYVLRLHAPIGVTLVSSSEVKSNFASIHLASLNGIVFDTTGAFGHRLLVTGATSGGERELIALDCSGNQFVINGALPASEGGLAVAPRTFGAFGGMLIAPDENTGKIWAFGADGTSQLVIDSGLPHGSDIGVESLGFVPLGFLRGGTVYVADRATANNPHPGSDSVLTLSSAFLVAAGVQEGDLLAVTEGGGLLIAVHCESTCSAIPIVVAATKAHAEGHLIFVTTAPPPSPSPSPAPSLATSTGSTTQPSSLGLVIAVVAVVAVIGAAAVVGFSVGRRRR